MGPGKLFQRQCKLVHATLDFLRVDRGESHLQTFALIRAARVHAERNDLYLTSFCCSPCRPAIDARRQPANRLQPCFDTGEFQQASESLARAIHQHRKSFGIDFAHAPQVPSKMAFHDEIAEHGLFKRWCMPG